jgi:ABC-2 type transport system permease protein
MNKVLNRYIPFAKAGMKGFLAYKAQVFLWLFISLIEVLFVVFLYHAIYRNSPDGINSVINGFTFSEMVLYMITSFVFSFVVFESDTSWNIYHDIKEGTIANTLTKPVSYRLRYLFTCFGDVFIGAIFVMLPLLVVTYSIFIGLGLISISISMMLINLLFFVIFLLIALVINDSICYLVGLLTFYTEHMFGLNMFKYSLQTFLSGVTIPLSYMGIFGVIFSYTPFAFLNSTPVLIIMGKVEITRILLYLGVAIFWLVIIEVFNKLLFNHCIKKVTVQGG